MFESPWQHRSSIFNLILSACFCFDGSLWERVWGGALSVSFHFSLGCTLIFVQRCVKSKMVLNHFRKVCIERAWLLFPFIFCVSTKSSSWRGLTSDSDANLDHTCCWLSPSMLDSLTAGRSVCVCIRVCVYGCVCEERRLMVKQGGYVCCRQTGNRPLAATGS